MDLLFLAIAPVIIIILYIYFKDKFEKEPISFLFKNFLLGATASILITALLGGFASKIIPLTDETSILQQFLKAFIVVAFVEEFSKYIIVRFYSQRS